VQDLKQDIVTEIKCRDYITSVTTTVGHHILLLRRFGVLNAVYAAGTMSATGSTCSGGGRP
jgi:hypothetical protein